VTADRRGSFRGALLGAALGDSLGAAFEGRPRVDAEDFHRHAGSWAPLRHTDDTCMTLVLAESLIESGGEIDPESLVLSFARAHAEEPWRGYGAGPPRVFDLVRRGVGWRTAARSLFGGRGSLGNGGAMRVTAVGLIAYREPARAIELARLSAAVTHAHPLGQEGAALQALAVAEAVGSSGRPLDARATLDALHAHTPHPVLRRQLERASGLIDGGPIAGVLGNGVSAQEAVPAALTVFLRHPDTFADAIAAAVCLGGDTDTIASMTGALAGARLGADAIPVEWRDRLEDAERIRATADLLLELWESRAA
jgi:poly(ADP-ribose) glycohydrolase ARH3